MVLALIFYSIGIITEQRTRLISRKVLIFLSLGLFFDILATCCMIAGSEELEFTVHGTLGYTALFIMIVETTLAFRFNKAHGSETKVSKALHLYSRFAYVLWLIAFFTGWAVASGVR